MINAYDSSPVLNDVFGFPQGAFDSSSEFNNLTAGNGAGLDFGTTMYFSGVEPVQSLPAIASSDIDAVYFENYVFFGSGVTYNFANANLVSIVPAVVPEPCSLPLFSLFFTGLFMSRQRSKPV